MHEYNAMQLLEIEEKYTKNKEQEHTTKKWEKETKNKTKGRLQVSTKKNIEQEELYDA